MTTINETVEQGMRNAGFGQYVTQARPIVQALVEREQTIAKGLADAAAQNGIDRREAVRIFEGLGIHTPVEQAQAAQAADGEQDLATMVRQLAETVGNLVTFARDRAGFRG